MGLTEKQQAFFTYLKNKLDGDGKAPSLREAAADLGVSHTAIAQLIQQLEKKGVIERQGFYSRTIRLTQATEYESDDRARAREIPVIGQVTAGLPMYAQQEWDGSIIVDGARFRGENLFSLRIRGDSMKDAGILNGDLVICEPRQYAENGEIVAALIHGEEATVKKFYHHSDHIEMRPANRVYKTMRYSFSELLVQGKVIGVIRDTMDLASAEESSV